MADLILSAVLPILIQKATDLVLGEFRAARGIEKDCQKLCRILPAVQAVVEDAEKRSKLEPAVRGWVSSLKAAAVEAEDVLDELKYDAIAEAVETEIQSEERKAPICLPRCSLFKNSIFKSYSDGKRLKGVLQKIEALVTEMNQFGFLKTFQPVPSVVDRPKSQSYVVRSTVIGRNDDLEKIVAKILSQSERERIAVLPIVGMGGLGKTTLAQLVYNSEMVQENFDLKLWVCVSDKFHVNNLAKSIIDLAIKNDSKVPLDNLELISQRLREELGGKRFLLVLDDVWNEIPEKWEDLKLLLDCGSPGSVVIVTTRSQKVGKIVHTMDAYNLKELNEEDLWGIFKQKAFQMGVNERPELVEIGKELIKKCCGSPLVATTLGGLMSYKKEESEWLDVLESDNLIVGNEIMPVLKLSYENLPSHMKRCFAFCVVYPKDFVMERDTLIQLWMANSYIPSEGSLEMEAKGIEIFSELAWRGFFHDIKETSWGAVECKMHDLIHDLAQSLVGTTCVSLPNSVQPSEVLLKETFHVSSSSKECIYSLFKECSTLRTILSSAEWYTYDGSNQVPIDLFKAKSSRALGFRGIPLQIRVEHKKLKHLRYLDLSFCRIEILPEALCTAYNLQTLLLNGCYNLVCLPEGMRHMRSLRHVNLEECDSLQQMPPGLGKLRCLQTLTRYIVDPAIGCGIEQLKDLNLGGLLNLRCLEKVGSQQEAKLANLVSKKRLSRLELNWGSSFDPDSARDVLEGLEPCRTLQNLEISNYNGVQFAAWMHNPTKLRSLTKLVLFECLQSKGLESIWQLPSLKELRLLDLESLNHICSRSTMLAQRQGDGDSQALHMFPKLESLILYSLKCLEKWQENDPAEQTSLVLPQLRILNIQNCPKLDVLPSCSMLEDLNLERVESLKHICCGGSSLPDQRDGRASPVFPKLMKLWLEDMKNLERWEESDAAESTSLALPQLHGLGIWCCPKLDALPYCPSVSSLTLKEVGLKYICSGQSSLLEPIFPMLQDFTLSNMSSLERWQENDPAEQTSLALPQLRKLWIASCPKLDALPSCPSLLSLTLHEVGLKYICSGQSSLLEPIFPMLQGFTLSNMSSLERWHQNDPAKQTSLALPKLLTLMIYTCPKLDVLPSCPLLTRLEIIGTSNIPSSVIESFKTRGVEVII